MLLTSILSALVVALSTTHVAADTGAHFKILIERYEGQGCTEDNGEKYRTEEVRSGQCFHGHHRQPFDSYKFHWDKHRWEDRPDNKDCDLHIFSDHRCKGDVVETIPGVEMGDDDNKCRDISPSGMSAIIDCEFRN
ncbi:unnamed protein product [Zymoseptoria tritici ST99CH_3D1]|uniref:Ecp2 effector protein domain-containing protein n=1 Tax=Zymoseptoria tritici (strain ST99CH_3D7) TaxID=1276538 RepID=A0A1X7S748_ZYMT9|nr:unnamed protein product [Zymoseptoria tritici ST99CH_3D7]SMR63783.1 unnamed protein product [Zymoseptoria tritici ST99CH_3D1]